MSGRGSWKSLIGKLTLAVAAPVLTLTLLEGCSSMVLFGWDFVKAPGPQTIAEEKHSTYDPELGWVSLPNVYLPNLYGPDVGFRTNGRGFRGKVDTSDSIAEGRRRLICSGDSFTLGYGVRDEDTWCAQLSDAIPGLETVNMGQGGYGIDQAYLWYKRDGLPLQHDVQVLAYITDDFRRMPMRRFAGYGKPVLELRGDSLAVTNVPAPQRGAAWRTTDRTTGVFRQTRLSSFFRRLGDGPGKTADSVARDSAAIEVAAAVVRDLVASHRKRGSSLVLVHLPVKADYNSAMSDRVRRRMAAVAEQQGVVLLDLVKTLGTLPRDSVASLYLLGDGHYSAAGNRWVARQLEPVIRAAPAAPR